MVKIKLQRTGRKNNPNYRIVVAPSEVKRSGRYLEKIGNYDPLSKSYRIDQERYDYWLSQGAQPTYRVAKIANGELKDYKKDA